MWTAPPPRRFSKSAGLCVVPAAQQRGLACYGKEDPLFEVLVTTGAMANAETASRVFLRIQGSKDQSTVIRLRDQNAVSVHDPLFQKGRVRERAAGGMGVRGFGGWGIRGWRIRGLGGRGLRGGCL